MDKEIKSSVFAKMAQHTSNENSTLSYNNINEYKMDSKAILKNIMTMLGVENKEVALGGNANAGGPFYGKLEDGSPVQSDFFDVGHVLLVVKEDGATIPAPDADHIIYLPVGLAGGSKRYFITTKDGIITSMHLEDNFGAKKVNVNFAAQTETEMEKTLSTEQLAASEKTYDETAPVIKEEKMADPAQRLDSLEEQVNQLRVDIAQVFEALKGKKEEEMAIETKDESAMVKKIQEVDQFQGKPNDGGPSKTNMSKEKKFTGAPVEEKVNLGGLVKSSKGGTVGSVLARMNSSRF
jgi:hypothetical protein